MIDLNALPRPEILEELDYEAELELLFNYAVPRFDERGIDFDAIILESEPVRVLLEVCAQRNTEIFAHANEAFRQTLLAYAKNSNLDQLVAWLAVERQAGESDARLRQRYRLASYGRSAGGPAERYKAVALGADVDVRDVAVWTEGRNPTVNVAVLSALANGEPTVALLAAVEDALMSDDVRVISDRFNVQSAIRRSVDVTVSIRLHPNALPTVADQVAAKIQLDWQAQDLLGLDLTHAFLAKTALSNPDVTNLQVIAPAQDEIADANEAIGLGTVSVTVSGRGR